MLKISILLLNLHKMGDFELQILYFWTKIIREEDGLKFRGRGQLSAAPPATTPPIACSLRNGLR